MSILDKIVLYIILFFILFFFFNTHYIINNYTYNDCEIINQEFIDNETQNEVITI